MIGSELKASEVMTPIPQTVTPTQTVAAAVDIMKSEDCGVVPVVSPEDRSSLVGIITDRDIALRACCEGSDGSRTPIMEAMTTNLFVVAPDDSLPHVKMIMEQAGVRRVPVVENNHLVGIISLKDLSDTLGGRGIGDTDTRILGQDPNN
ncbi:MAG: CBS domain-containing protein [Candidatus Kapaibacterium sp.]